jgi:hypothetical protein
MSGLAWLDGITSANLSLDQAFELFEDRAIGVRQFQVIWVGPLRFVVQIDFEPLPAANAAGGIDVGGCRAAILYPVCPLLLFSSLLCI